MGMETNKKIKAYRKMAELTQAQLGERCGMHLTEISVYERGARNPTLTTIARIANGLGIHPSKLLPDWIDPLVRCKDCKRCAVQHNHITLRYQLFCTHGKGYPEVSADDFCSYGERKDDHE